MAAATGWSWGNAWGDEALEEEEDDQAAKVSNTTNYTHAQISNPVRCIPAITHTMHLIVWLGDGVGLKIMAAIPNCQ